MQSIKISLLELATAAGQNSMPITRRFCVAKARHLAMLFILSLLSACASNVTVKSSVPTPLVQPLPLNIHLDLTDEFKSYVYQEADKKRALKSLDLAQAQVSMFTKVFNGIATVVTADDPRLDLTVQPEIIKFEYLAPRDTSLNQYEVSLRYRLKITDSNEQKLADWVIKGFGKTPTAMLSSGSKAFNSATNIALRDVGAQLAIYFRQQPAIAALIDQKQNIAMGAERSDNVTSIGGLAGAENDGASTLSDEATEPTAEDEDE